MANEEYYIGQTFEPPYPPAVATWCQKNGAEIIVREDGLREIVAAQEPTEQEQIQERIAELKAELSSTDYVVIKIAEADTTEEQQQLREHYADVIANRKVWRTEINTARQALRDEINELEE